MIEPLIQAASDAVRRGDFSLAEGTLRQIVAIEPGNAWAHALLGAVLAEVDRVEEAVAAMQQSLRHRPDDAGTLANCAALLYRLGREDQGIPLSRRALALRPDDARSHMILAEALLRQGEYEEGFAEYEWRLRMPSYPQHGRSDLPPALRWEGSNDVAGKTILLHAEQGLGDMLWAIRYAPLLARRGARVIVECEAVMRSLLSRRVEVLAGVVARGEGLPPFDLHCPLMSLPHAFRTTMTTIPAEGPYLSTNTVRSSAAKSIGLAWAGGPKSAPRSFPVAALEQFMASTPAVRWVSLQMPGPHVQPLNPPSGALFEDPESWRGDLEQTAGVIDSLDLILTVDSALAHLAGAMGKPVWMMTRFAPDWRWLRERTDSPWYPTMRLFRQRARGDWESLTHDVDAALRQLP